MTDTDPSPEETEIPEAEIQPAKPWGWLWILPLIAIAIAGTLTWLSLGDRGLPIRIHFKQGHGLKAGDPLRYRGIDVGKVETIELNGLEGIVAEVRLLPSAAELARKESRFWIVRPMLDLSGPRGLETVVGAKYLQVAPGTGARQVVFEGLPEPPIVKLDEGGLEITLRSSGANGLTAGAPVTYRQIAIGTLIRVGLNRERNGVEVKVNIRPEFRPLVQSDTRFWKTGGARFSADLLKGINVDVGSVNSLLLGGVSIAVPPGGGEPAMQNHVFDLHDAPEPEWERWNDLAAEAEAAGGLEIQLVARKAGGMNPGSPVTFRQVKIGSLLSVGLAPGGSNIVVRAQIEPAYRDLVDTNTQFWKAGGAKFTAGLLSGIQFDMDSLHSVVLGGVSMARPPDRGVPVSDGHHFILHEEAAKEWENWLE